MNGEPSGVPPMKIMRYSAATRPRMTGSVVSWMVALAAVIIVSAQRPSSGSTSA